MRATIIEASAQAWERVAAAVVERRVALGHTQEELAAAAGVSPTTLRQLETANRQSYRSLTLAKIAAALDWPASRFVELVAGVAEEDLAPTSVADDLRDERINALEARVDDMSQKVGMIYDRLVGGPSKRAAKKSTPRG